MRAALSLLLLAVAPGTGGLPAAGAPAAAQVNRAAAAVAAPVNLAPRAHVAASFTASNALLRSVNDGRLPQTPSSMESWHTWGGLSDPVTIAYQWPLEVRLSALDVAWWYDQTDAAAGGVQRPVRAAVEYWTGSAWRPVSGLKDGQGQAVEAVPTEGSGTAQRNTVYNRVSFEPVSTTGIRLVLAQNRAAVTSTGTGIAEWRVFSDDPASVIFSEISFPDPQWTTRNLVLPRAAGGYALSWSSDRPLLIDHGGVVRRGERAEPVVLRATARVAGQALRRDYPFQVLPTGSAGRTLELDLDRPGIVISPHLYGLFFEDICHALDGGLNANLVDNGSFQQYNWPTPLPETVSNRGPNDDRYSLDPREIYSWSEVGRGGAAGTATIVDSRPLNANNGYSVEIRVSTAGSGPDRGFGIAANGYAEQATNVRQPSMPIVAGVGYELSLFIQGDDYPGNVRAWLETAAGERNSNVVEFGGLGGAWRKYRDRLTALRSEDSRLVIAGGAVGTFWLDYVVLKPEPAALWRDGAAGGLRADMAQAMADIHPRFLRFPGGCASEGKSEDRLYHWKHTVGAPEARRQLPNYWGYWSSNEIGFLEYFEFAEQLGAEPLPVVGLGMSCPFHRGSNYYEAPIDTVGCAACRQQYLATYVQDALDLIEFANGDVSTRWGRIRAELGHPAPFHLKYISLGNENWGESFWERFDVMYRAVHEAYPEITIISTAGPYASGRQLNDNYRQIDAHYQATTVDEHYYMASSWFLNNTHRYDASSVRGDQGLTYDRARPTRVFVGEYADAGSGNHFMSALYEAAFTTGLERNSDLVVMASYAPLFCKQGMTNWNSNLIWFDNRGLWRTPNYWYQWIFSNHVGDLAVPDHFSTYDAPAAPADVLTAPSLDTRTGTVFLKLVNVEPQAKEIRVVLHGGAGGERRASYVYIRSDELLVRNQGSADYSELVRPVTEDLGTIRDAIILTVPAQSVGALVLRPTR